MNYPPHIWAQLKSITAEELIAALKRDGYVRDTTCKAEHVYLHRTRGRVSVHFHPGKTYGPKLLKGLLADIGWNIEDLRRLKLAK